MYFLITVRRPGMQDAEPSTVVPVDADTRKEAVDRLLGEFPAREGWVVDPPFD